MHTSAPSPRLQHNVRAPRAQLAQPAAAATTLHRQCSQPRSVHHAAHAWPRQQSSQPCHRHARRCRKGCAVAASQQREADPRGLSGAAAAVIASSGADATAALDLSTPDADSEQTPPQPPAAAAATGASAAFEARAASANADAELAQSSCLVSSRSDATHGTMHGAASCRGSLNLRVQGADGCVPAASRGRRAGAVSSTCWRTAK